MKKIFTAAAAALVVMCSNGAEAAFIDSGTYLTDTTSGLDWLDVSASRNRSYDDVSTQFAAGGDFAGWRYANWLEFQGLIDHWTRTVSGPATLGILLVHPDGAGSIDGLSAALGAACGYVACPAGDPGEGFAAYTQGIVDSYAWTPSLRNTSIIMDDDIAVYNNNGGPGQDYTWAQYGVLVMSDVPLAWVGSFLIRQTEASLDEPPTRPSGTVPEPTTIALFGLGLAGLSVSRRKIKTKNLS